MTMCGPLSTTLDLDDDLTSSKSTLVVKGLPSALWPYRRRSQHQIWLPTTGPTYDHDHAATSSQTSLQTPAHRWRQGKFCRHDDDVETLDKRCHNVGETQRRIGRERDDHRSVHHDAEFVCCPRTHFETVRVLDHRQPRPQLRRGGRQGQCQGHLG